MNLRAFAAVVVGLCCGTLRAQGETAGPGAVSLIDGTLVIGRVEAGVKTGGAPGLRIRLADGETRDVAMSDVLAVHGAAPRSRGTVRVHLVGGDELAGRLAAGDAAGETFSVVSPTLGVVKVPIDRLAVLVFPERAPAISEPGAAAARMRDFEIAPGADRDEALFRRARRGFDMTLGEIHRFTDDGVVFAVEGRDPELVPFEELAAVSLRGGLGRERPASAELVTRTGDRIGVDLVGVDGGVFTVRIEDDDRELELPGVAISALTFRGEGRAFLSDLELENVEESSFFSETGEPVWPFARDRTATGGCLRVGRLAFGKGIGAHSRSRLTWRVPEGAGAFVAWVGLDDSVLGLNVRAEARVAVRLDGKLLTEVEHLRAGSPPNALGRHEVRPGARLTLEVDYGEGLDLGDRVDWLNVVFLE